MRVAVAAITLFAPLALAPAAQAQGPYAHAAIQQGDYQAAERKLLAEARVFPHKPEVLLNLAAVYARTGRAAAARTLYDRVLALEPVAMDVIDGQIELSHLIASRGLQRIAQTDFATR